jgi:hypothetical protein
MAADPNALYLQQEMNNNFMLPSSTAGGMERNNSNSYNYPNNNIDVNRYTNATQYSEHPKEDPQPVVPFNIPTRLNSTIASTTLLRPQKPGELLPVDFVPTALDVCSGRGKRNWNHGGNVAFRDLIQHMTPAYMAAMTKNEKTAIVCNIVEDMRALGCKFLKQHSTTGRWHDIGDAQARDKVGHSLRDQVTAYNRTVQHTSPQIQPIQESPMEASAMSTTFENRHTSPPETPDRMTHSRRPSIALSDSGNEADLRRMSLDTTALFGEFVRRPSWIAGENESAMDVIAVEDDDVPGELPPMPTRGSHPERRISSSDFLDAFDYYIEHDIDLPFNSSSRSINEMIERKNPPTTPPISDSTTPLHSQGFRRPYSRNTSIVMDQSDHRRESMTVADLQAHSLLQAQSMLHDSVHTWDPRLSSNLSSLMTFRRSAMSGGTTIRRLTNSFRHSSIEELMDGIDFSEDSSVFLGGA